MAPSLAAWNSDSLRNLKRFPQNNGLAEGTLQTANKVLKKAYEDKKYPCLEILEQRNTIPGVGLSPTLLLMGRHTCRTLHCIFYAVVGLFLVLILFAVSWISFTLAVLRHSL